MCVSNTPTIHQHSVRMNHCEAHLVVTSRVIDSKGLSVVGVFQLMKRQNDECNDRNVQRWLFGMCPDVTAFKVLIFTNDYTF